MEYDKKHIDELLRAYYDGTSTLAQEKLLREYFGMQKDVEKEHMADAALLGGLAAVKDRRRLRSRRRTIALATLSAAAAVSAVAMLAVWQQKGPETVPYCIVNGVPVTDLQTAEKYTLDILSMVERHAPDSETLILDKLSADI